MRAARAQRVGAAAEPGGGRAPDPATILVTSRSLYTTRRALRALKRNVPDAFIHRTAFTGIFLVEAEGDPLELASRISQQCAREIGRAVAVVGRVPSKAAEIREAAARAGAAAIGRSEAFSFRLHKRGAHELAQDTPALEHEIGGAIWTALARSDGEKPSVRLRDPDVTILAEVLGPETLIGVWKRAWQPLARRRRMLDEPHDLRREFPEYAAQIDRLKQTEVEFAKLLEEYDGLDAKIRDLEQREQPVADAYMEDLKKRRIVLKDRLYAWLRASGGS